MADSRNRTEYMREYQRKRAKQARYGACLEHAQKLASRLVGIPQEAWANTILQYLLDETNIKG